MATPAKPVRARRVTVKHPEPVEAFAELKQMDPPCNHCYCQPSADISNVPHRECCKCGDRMAHRAQPSERPPRERSERPEPMPTRPDPFESRPRRWGRKGRINDDESGRPKPV